MPAGGNAWEATRLGTEASRRPNIDGRDAIDILTFIFSMSDGFVSEGEGFWGELAHEQREKLASSYVSLLHSENKYLKCHTKLQCRSFQAR